MSFLKSLTKKEEYNFRRYPLLIVSVLVAVADQWSKRVILDLYERGALPIDVFSWFKIVFVKNRGALWGLGNGLPEFWRVAVFVVISAIFTLVILWLLFYRKTTFWQSLAYALVVGGAFGNIYDRFFRGYVVDFILWYYRDFKWPAFNVADAMIVVAMFIIGIDMLFERTLLEKR